MRRVVIGVGMVGVVVGLFFWPDTDLLLAVLPHGRSASPTAYGTAFVLLVAGALGLFRARTARLAGGATGVLGLVLVVLAARSAVRTGLPDDGTGVLVAAGTLTGLAVVVGALVAARADRPDPVWRPVLAGVLAAVLVVAGAVGFARLAAELPVRSVTAAPAGPAAAVPVGPGTPRWTWRSPVGAHTVLPIATGVVVALRDGSVVALDGRDGAPRWSFGRTGSTVDIQATPDGRHVLAEHAAGRGDGGSRGRTLTVLDADTGARLWDAPAFTPAAVEPVRVLTDRVLVVGTAAPTAPGRFGAVALEARGLTDGYPMWTATRPGCEAAASPLTSRSAAPVLWSCPGTADVVEGLDEGTGQQRWQVDARAVTGLPETAQTYLDSSLDGRHLLLSATDHGSGTRRPSPRLVLDPGTGVVLTRFDDVAIARNPGRPVAYAVTDGDFPVGPLRPEIAVGPSGTVALPGGCGPFTEITVAATDTTVVRVCHSRSGVPLVQIGDRAPAPVGLDAVDSPFRDTSGSRAEVVDPDGSPAAAFAVAAPGAVVVGVPQQAGTVLVGLA